jgi:intraflagellar transport protein 74
LRTGIAPSGAGTQAAQGLALSANVTVSDRPVTGHGVMGMKAQGQNTGRLVQDSAYYVGLLRKKISDVNSETIKLRSEIDQQSKDNTQYTQLERRYEQLLKNKEQLEGQLADYNLALDKIRSATDPEDVHQMAAHMAEKNRQTGQDLDRIFMQRKQREQETMNMEDQIETIHRSIQKRINDMDSGRLRYYNELMLRQKELQDRLLANESRLNSLNTTIRSYEADEKTNSLRKEYLILERKLQSLRKEKDSLQEELDIANLDPKDAHTRFVQRVNTIKQTTKAMEDRVQSLQQEIQQTKKQLEELQASTSMAGNANGNNELDAEEMAKYELLQKRDQDMTSFMDNFEITKQGIFDEQRQVQYMIVALLEHIGKGIDASTALPTTEALQEMESAKQFKEKNLLTAQKTMENLVSEKKKRERELDLLRASEPKLMTELTNLREAMSKMRSEMEDFQDLDRLRREFQTTKAFLMDMKTSYLKRRDTMRQQLQSVSNEYESLKKQLNSHEIGRELDDTEKRLKHYERSIFELREFVETKTRETDFEHVKTLCLKLSDQLNQNVMKECQQLGTSGMFNNNNNQAKGGW